MARKIEINSVLQGDCLELMKDIPDKSIDMVLCDLPYGTTACSWDVIIPFESLWEQYKRIIKDNGAIVLTASQPFTTKLIASNYEMFKYEWIWEKHTGSNFAQIKHMPFKQHENILIFATSGFSKYNPQMQPKKESSKNRLKYNISNAIDRSSSEGNKHKRMYSDEMIISDYRYPSSVQRFNRSEGGLHPTQKPVALFEYLIRTYTNEGDLVLDNCAGSGTTAIAAINTKRNYICMELNETYYKLIKKRIRKHTSEKPLI